MKTIPSHLILEERRTPVSLIRAETPVQASLRGESPAPLIPPVAAQVSMIAPQSKKQRNAKEMGSNIGSLESLLKMILQHEDTNVEAHHESNHLREKIHLEKLHIKKLTLQHKLVKDQMKLQKLESKNLKKKSTKDYETEIDDSKPTRLDDIYDEGQLSLSNSSRTALTSGNSLLSKMKELREKKEEKVSTATTPPLLEKQSSENISLESSAQPCGPSVPLEAKQLEESSSSSSALLENQSLESVSSSQPSAAMIKPISGNVVVMVDGKITIDNRSYETVSQPVNVDTKIKKNEEEYYSDDDDYYDYDDDEEEEYYD